MTAATLIILLLLTGLVLLVAEMLLPSHGVLGVLGAVVLAAGVVVCYRVDSRIGLAALLVLVVAAPFAGMLWIKLWPRTPLGRRMILGPATTSVAEAGVEIGQTGVAASELRPMGVCDFGAGRVEARAEFGTIPAGQRVRVVAVVDRRPTVRAV